MIRTALLVATLGAMLSAGGAAASPDELQALLSKYIAWRGGPQFEALQVIHEKGRSASERSTALSSSGSCAMDVCAAIDRWGHSPIPKPSPPDDWKTNASGQLEDLADGGQTERRAVALAFADVGKPDSGMTYRLLGTERCDERAWTVVRVDFGGPDTYDLYLDPASGELLGERITEDRATRFLRFGQWRSVSGVRMPFDAHLTSANAAADEYARVDSVELNSAPESEVFARPACCADLELRLRFAFHRLG